MCKKNYGIENEVRDELLNRFMLDNKLSDHFLDGFFWCPRCQNEYMHIISTIRVNLNKTSNMAEFIFNDNYKIAEKYLRYPYDLNDNIHILLACENMHFLIISFDRTNGNLFLNANSLMKDVAKELNNIYKEKEYNNCVGLSSLYLDYALLGNIESALSVVCRR